MTKLEQTRKYEAETVKAISAEERPLYHVTPAAGWMNDPNGFSAYQGECHLFYQYYPYGTKWGPMHWGHYKTGDFIHWEMVPAALAPEANYESGCFSGSAIETADGQHLLMYTAHLEQDQDIKETQCVAIGNGVDYQKIAENPVLTVVDLPEGSSAADFRDPKIWWEDGYYYAVIANRLKDGKGAILLYRSEDCRKWQFITILAQNDGSYGTMWECPDFFELDGKQVLVVSPMHMKARGLDFHNGHVSLVFLGDYDSQNYKFTQEAVQMIDYGIDFYAPQTTTAPDGRRIMIGWMQNWGSSQLPPEDAKWFGMMTIPRELQIRDGRLIQNPVREIEACRTGKVSYLNETVTAGREFAGINGRTIDMTVVLDLNQSPDCSRFEIRLASNKDHFTKVTYSVAQDIITVDRTYSGICHDTNHIRRMKVEKKNGKVKLRFLLDRFSMEMFVNDGEQAFSMTLYETPKDADQITFSADGAAVIDIEKFTFLAEQ